jgi:hypothetical protein
MPGLSELVAALYGAWRLAHFDRRGLGYFDRSPGAFWRSFFAAVLIAPVFALAVVLSAGQTAASAPLRFGAVELIAYILSWVAFPVVMEWLSRRLNRRDRYPLYITAYNWSAVIQYGLMLPIAILARVEAIPADLSLLLWLGGSVFVLALAHFLARIALAVDAGTAAGVVLLDLVISVIISGVSSALETTTPLAMLQQGGAVQ